MRRPQALLLATVAALALMATWAGCAGDTDRSGVAPPSGESSPAAEESVAREPVREHVTAAEPAASEPVESHALAVRITSPGGRPVADAEILVTARARHWGARPRTVADGVTDATGVLRLQLPPGGFVVRGTHDDMQILGSEVDVPDEETVHLLAAPGPRLRVVVRDENGAAIEGAVAWELHEHAGTVATTGVDGRADLGRVYPRNPFVLVEAAGYARASNYAFGTWDGRDEYEHRVTLRRATEVRVHVVDHDGTPAAGVLLTGGGARDACDADGFGRLAVAEIEKGCWIQAEHTDGREVRQLIEEVPADGEVVELRLPPFEPLRGRVVHAWTGEPVAGARVLVQPDQETEYTLGADADDEGVFELPHATRDVRIVAFAPGLARSGEDWTHVEPEEDGTYTISVAPTMRLTGRIVDRRGEPLAGARLWLVTWGDAAPMAATPVERTSAADGTFAFAEVPAVPNVIVMAQPGRGIGWSAVDLEIPPTPGSAYHVGDIAIPDGFDLDVPVTDDDGEPLAGGIVWVRWRIVGQGMPAAHRQVHDGAMDPIDGIPQDGAVAEVTAPGCLKTVRRIDASTESLVADRPCVVRGRVARTDGSPVAGVWVIAESKDQLHTLEGNHGGAETGSDGRFAFGGVRRGRYAFRVRTEDYQRIPSDTTEIDVRARTTDLGDVVVE